MDPYELRRLDFTLEDEHEAIRDSFGAFFANECPTSLVRAAEPMGHDDAFWKKLSDLGATSMALPESVGGDGAGIVEMTLVASELGRTLAPAPLLDHVVATRLLAASGSEIVSDLLAEATAGLRILAFAARPFSSRQLVASAAVADTVVGLHNGRLVVLTPGTQRAHVPNQASLPSAWVDPQSEQRLEIGGNDQADLFARAVREHKVLTAAALCGLTQGALDLAVDFAKSRQTMGVSIATLQGVSFPLADIAIGIAGLRNLSLRAAWFLDHEPDNERALPAAAHAYASQVAMHGATAAQHAQGGLGFTVEADASLYFLRAKGWALAAGDPADDLREVADSRLATATAH